MHLEKGHVLNKNCYQITKVIGQGGFGITYLADEIGFFRNTGFGDTQYVRSRSPEQVVIKELYYSEYCSRNKTNNHVIVTNKDKEGEFFKLVQNQLDEGKKLRVLDHPNVVHTRDIFKENNTAYMVMEYIDGFDMDGLLEKVGKIPQKEAVKYISEILSALKHIHERNQLHLDIKPSNILIRKSNSQAVLIDFGASQSYDTSGEIVGRTSQLVSAMTKCYAPNEQADIDNLKHFDATFDTYAVGATLYHMLTGQRPPASSLLSTGREKLTPPTTFMQKPNSDYPDAIIAKALAPLYHNRFKTAENFSAEFQKEESYIINVAKIDTLLNSKNFAAAKEMLNDAKNNFLPTETLSRFDNAIIAEEKRVKNEVDFENFYRQGIEMLNKNDYQQAKNLLKKALFIYPENEDVSGKINFCENQLRLAASKSENEQTELIVSKKNQKDADQTVLIDAGSEKQKTSDKTVIISSLKKNEKEKHSVFSNVVFTHKIKISMAVVGGMTVLLLLVFILNNGKKKSRQDTEQQITEIATEQPDTVSKPTAEDTSQGETPPVTTPKQVENKTVEKTPKQVENKTVEKTESKENISNKTITTTEKTETAAITYKGKKYTGTSSKGVPNGTGTLYYNSTEIVSENDAKLTKAEAGDYVKGKWNNGELEYGTLYDKAGNKKTTIIIGRY